MQWQSPKYIEFSSSIINLNSRLVKILFFVSHSNIQICKFHLDVFSAQYFGKSNVSHMTCLFSIEHCFGLSALPLCIFFISLINTRFKSPGPGFIGFSSSIGVAELCRGLLNFLIPNRLELNNPCIDFLI